MYNLKKSSWTVTIHFKFLVKLQQTKKSVGSESSCLCATISQRSNWCTKPKPVLITHPDILSQTGSLNRVSQARPSLTQEDLVNDIPTSVENNAKAAWQENIDSNCALWALKNPESIYSTLHWIMKGVKRSITFTERQEQG